LSAKALSLSYLFEQAREVLWRLRCDSLNITLKYQEIACLNENVLGFQRVVVCFRLHQSVVDTVLALASRCDATLPTLLLSSIVLVHGHDPRSLWIVALCAGLGVLIVILVVHLSSALCLTLAIIFHRIAIRVDLVVLQDASAVDQVSEMCRAQV
jgi:hypothetical protein